MKRRLAMLSTILATLYSSQRPHPLGDKSWLGLTGPQPYRRVM